MILTYFQGNNNSNSGGLFGSQKSGVNALPLGDRSRNLHSGGSRLAENMNSVIGPPSNNRGRGDVIGPPRGASPDGNRGDVIGPPPGRNSKRDEKSNRNSKLNAFKLSEMSS
jgi:hypothetical protein